MTVKCIITGDIYKKVINYMLKKCDVVSFAKYQDQHQARHEEVMKIIFSNNNYSPENIYKDYSEEFLNILFQQFKNNPEIFDEEYKNRYEKGDYSECHDLINRRMSIYSSVGRFLYENVTETWLKQNSDNILFETKVFNKTLMSNKNHHSTIYYVKLNNKIKEEIMNKNSFYDWCFPKSLEDICFYKDGYYCLYSVGHEEICDIYCETEEEYEYFKSLGIEFVVT